MDDEQELEAGNRPGHLSNATEWSSADQKCTKPGGGKMLYYALVFFIIAVIAGMLGFGVIASAAAGIAKFCSSFSWCSLS